MADWQSWSQRPALRALRGRDLLTLAQLTPGELEALLEFASALKAAGPYGSRELLAGQAIALIFEKPSTRTRVSFEVAIWQLGGHAVTMTTQQMQLGRGETWEDTGRVLSRYVQGVVVRTFAQEGVEALAEAASVPVINALTDRFHPCQVLADLLTLKEHFGRLRGLKLTYVGDGNNMAHSLMLGGALAGLDVVVCTPPGYEPDPEVVAHAQRLAERSGCSVRLSHRPEEAAAAADALYTDVWTSMGQEAERERRLRDFQGFQLNEELLKKAASHAVVLHCLPAHRGEEITAGVLEGEQSLVFPQAENRLHVQKAVLAALLGF